MNNNWFLRSINSIYLKFDVWCIFLFLLLFFFDNTPISNNIPLVKSEIFTEFYLTTFLTYVILEMWVKKRHKKNQLFSVLPSPSFSSKKMMTGLQVGWLPKVVGWLLIPKAVGWLNSKSGWLTFNSKNGWLTFNSKSSWLT